jgi:hypothetical protein
LIFAEVLYILLIINKSWRYEAACKRCVRKLGGSLEELKNRRFSNVGLLALRALEQMMEACVAKEGLHFHGHPRTAHKNRLGASTANQQDANT